MRNAALAKEVYFIDAERYLSCANAACHKLPEIKKLSEGVVLVITATTTGFTGTSKHPQGTGKILRWSSDQVGFVSPKHT